QSRVGSAAPRALGATPVWFAGGDPIDGFGGIEQPVSFIAGNRYDLVGRYLTANVALWARPLVVFANRKAFERLDAAERRALEQGAPAVVPAATRVIEATERADTATVCARRHVGFVTASAADLAALRRAVAPVYDDLRRDPLARRFLATVEAIRRRLGA